MARSVATKQSPTLTLPRRRGREGRGLLDCFASLAMTSRHHALRLFDDGEAHAGPVAMLFRDLAPAVLGLLAGLERTLHLRRALHQLVEIHRAELAADHPEIAAVSHDCLLLAELVHCVMGAAGLQRRLAREIFLMVVADVGASHVLMPYAGDSLTDLLTLHVLHIAEHALLAEIFPCKVVGGQRRGVIGRQRDEVMEDAGALGRIRLEAPDQFVGFDRQRSAVVLSLHQLGAIVLADVPTAFLPAIVNL